MTKIKFVIDTDSIGKPIKVIRLICDCITLICGSCTIEAPKGYKLKEKLDVIEND